MSPPLPVTRLVGLQPGSLGEESKRPHSVTGEAGSLQQETSTDRELGGRAVPPSPASRSPAHPTRAALFDLSSQPQWEGKQAQLLEGKNGGCVEVPASFFPYTLARCNAFRARTPPRACSRNPKPQTLNYKSRRLREAALLPRIANLNSSPRPCCCGLAQMAKARCGYI